MLLPTVAVVAGLAALVWSADRFVDGASTTARHLGMPALLIGMVIVGFGTSAPEVVVSVFAALDGSSGIALGNAYGSNITNIALILGVTAIISPIAVKSQILRRELPLLVVVTALTAWQLSDGSLSRIDAVVLLVVFAAFMVWSVVSALRGTDDALTGEFTQELASHRMPLRTAVLWLVVGFVVLVVSSRTLVWGAVNIAQSFGVSDLFIGLTIVAVGTSLPELASSIVAARRGEHDIAIGNVIGSNLFNTLLVVGVAGVIEPLKVESTVMTRDMTTMGALTVSLFLLGYGFQRNRPRGGRINRIEGTVLVVVYVAYLSYLVATARSGG